MLITALEGITRNFSCGSFNDVHPASLGVVCNVKLRVVKRYVGDWPSCVGY